MRSVVVAKYVPWPPNSGDKRRTLGVVRALREHGHVTVCAFAGPDEDAAPLVEEGIAVRSVRRRRSLLALAAGLVRGRTITSARFWDPALARVVQQAVSEDADVLVIEHVQLLPYLSGRGRTRHTVVDMHNIESSLTSRYADSQRGLKRLVLRLEALALERLEQRSATADVVAVVSDLDRSRLLDLVPSQEIVVVPNAWDVPEPLPASDAPVVCFVALMSWAPNEDAATWLVREIWPDVISVLPEARLLLVGRNPTPTVQGLAGPTVDVTGTVPDLTPYYSRSQVAVAPLRAGGGSRLKILEALAHGRPVVATTVGVEGLEDLVGRGVVVADDPAVFAKTLVDMLVGRIPAADLGRAGAAAVEQDHSWGAATRPLLSFLEART